MPEQFEAFLPFIKIDKAKRLVYGWASTPTKDLDGEVITLAAIQKALPGYLEWSNIREMHRAVAAGVCKAGDVFVDGKPTGVGKNSDMLIDEVPPDQDGLFICSKCVDNDAWEKVQEGVYKGYSIGGRRISKVGDEIRELELIEISYVDRPANPDCRISMVKAAGIDSSKSSAAPLTIFDEDAVAATIRKVLAADKTKAEESTKAINDLPDSDFAYIEPGGTKDDEGKTTPRSKRHLPIHDAAHVRDALSRISQTNIPPAAKAKAMGKIRARAKKFGVKVGDQKAKAALVAGWVKDAGRHTEIRKHLRTVAWLAYWLTEFRDYAIPTLERMAEELVVESQREGDQSVVPEMLYEVIEDFQPIIDKLGATLVALVTEEIGEIKDGTEDDSDQNDDAEVALMALMETAKKILDIASAADPTIQVNKKGAVMSAANKASVQKAAGHIAKAIAAHGVIEACMKDAMDECAKVAKGMTDADLLKATNDALKGHLVKAADAMDTMEAHHSSAKECIGKLLSDGSAGTEKAADAVADKAPRAESGAEDEEMDPETKKLLEGIAADQKSIKEELAKQGAEVAALKLDDARKTATPKGQAVVVDKSGKSTVLVGDEAQKAADATSTDPKSYDPKDEEGFGKWVGALINGQKGHSVQEGLEKGTFRGSGGGALMN